MCRYNGMFSTQTNLRTQQNYNPVRSTDAYGQRRILDADSFYIHNKITTLHAALTRLSYRVFYTQTPFTRTKSHDLACSTITSEQQRVLHTNSFCTHKNSRPCTQHSRVWMTLNTGRPSDFDSACVKLPALASTRKCCDVKGENVTQYLTELGLAGNKRTRREKKESRALQCTRRQKLTKCSCCVICKRRQNPKLS